MKTGDKITVKGQMGTVIKAEDDRVLVRFYGVRKWVKIEDVAK